MDFQLNGKVVLVTGASSGIGEACAVLFSQLGSEVVLVGRNEENLLKVKKICDKGKRKNLTIKADLTQEHECEKTVKQVVDEYGKIDILVNNAGIVEYGSIETTSLEQYDRIMNINLRAVYHMMMLCVPHLSETRGSIVNVSSVSGTRPSPGMLAYCLSKSALDQLTNCSAIELAPKGIRVNSVNPGVIVTELHKSSGMDEETYKNYLERCKRTHPLGRVGEASEVARSVCFLSSPLSSFTTAQQLHVDGGKHASSMR